MGFLPLRQPWLQTLLLRSSVKAIVVGDFPQRDFLPCKLQRVCFQLCDDFLLPNRFYHDPSPAYVMMGGNEISFCIGRNWFWNTK